MMEDTLRDSGLDWTVVRPPRLTGDYPSQLGLALGFLGLAVASLALGLPSTMDGA
jgi:hypothetical protein